MTLPVDIELAARLVALCAEKSLRVAVAESCTGGVLSAAITDIPGASAVFDRGFVTYSNAAKTELLDVDEALIAVHGAVSEAVASAMVLGALTRTGCDLAAATTGIAGPGGGTAEKPVGLVFIAAGGRFGPVRCEEHHFPGSRDNVRQAAALKALEMLHDIACQS